MIQLGSHVRIMLAAALTLLVFARIAAANILALPIESDGRAYMLMAEAMAAGRAPMDQFGQNAFYSIGYPLVLTPFLFLFGNGLGTIICANSVLALASGWLVFLVARVVGLAPKYCVLAVVLLALWIPGIWNAAQAAKENLSVPLLLLLLLSALMLLRDGGWKWSAIAGFAFGAGVLTGGSTLLLAGVLVLAVLLNGKLATGRKTATVSVIAVCSFAILAPWLLTTSVMLGTPTLNTNGGFNLYLGNNPAATGRFVSIADTPAGHKWEELRRTEGEVGASRILGEQAQNYILAHPERTFTLGFTKLALFWKPNIPDADDFVESPMITSMRVVEVLQYVLLLAGGILGFGVAVKDRQPVLLCTATIGLFWVLHAAAYIIPRYRDPVMPVLLIGATALIGWIVNRTLRRGGFDA